MIRELQPPIGDSIKPETLGHRVQHRMIEFVRDTMDSVGEAWETEVLGSADKKGIDAGVRIAGQLVAPDITIGDERTVLEKVKRMARNPFTKIKTPAGGEETALRLVIRGNPDDWQDFCDQADRSGQRVSENQPHDVVARQKRRILEQIRAEIKIFKSTCSGDAQEMKILKSIEAGLEDEWVD
jgi:hypothetical protein